MCKLIGSTKRRKRNTLLAARTRAKMRGGWKVNNPCLTETLVKGKMWQPLSYALGRVVQELVDRQWREAFAYLEFPGGT